MCNFFCNSQFDYYDYLQGQGQGILTIELRIIDIAIATSRDTTVANNSYHFLADLVLRLLFLGYEKIMRFSP